jgi:diguanylate cyclase (GGDEF)-like protein
MGPRPASVSGVVYMEVVGTLHSTLVPIVLTGAAQAIAGTIAARQTGDIVTAILMAIGVAVDCIRAMEVLAFRRRAARKPPLDLGEAARWGRRYAIGTAATSLILGLFAARGLVLDSAICSMTAIGLAFGFSAGVVARLSMLPRLALFDLTVLGLPSVVVSFAQFDTPHAGLAMSIVIFVIGGFEMVRLTFNSTVNQFVLKEQFKNLARLDPMTGVFNRSVLASDLPEIIADRDGGIVAVYAIDLDHFKAANDRFGHPVGDALLKQVADRLNSLAGPDGLVVRMGGDEFILVQPGLRSRHESEALARRIWETVSAAYDIAGHDIIIGASIGVALSPEDGQSVEQLLSRSDKALYQAKVGRGGHVFAGDLISARPAADKSAGLQPAAPRVRVKASMPAM